MLGLGVALVAFVLAYLYLPPIGSYSPRALSYSLTLRLGGATDFSHCERRGKHVYACAVSNGSGGSSFRVRTHGRCWSARRTMGGDLKPRVKGCVRWRDQLRIWEHLAP